MRLNKDYINIPLNTGRYDLSLDTYCQYRIKKLEKQYSKKHYIHLNIVRIYKCNYRLQITTQLKDYIIQLSHYDAVIAIKIIPFRMFVQREKQEEDKMNLFIS